MGISERAWLAHKEMVAINTNSVAKHLRVSSKT